MEQKNHFRGETFLAPGKTTAIFSCVENIFAYNIAIIIFIS